MQHGEEKRKRYKMRAFFITPLAIFLIMVLIMMAKLLNSNDSGPSPLIGQHLPAFNLAAAYEGTPGLINTDIISKYSLLNIFGSWCLTCQIEHPFLMKLKENNVLPIYGIDWKDTPENLAKYLKKLGNPYKSIGDDVEGKAAIDLGVTGAPETFLVSPEGIVLFRYAGPLTEEVWNLKILPLIEGGKK